MFKLVALILAASLAASTEASERKARQLSTVTSTSLVTSTSFATTTLTTKTVCVNYINATSACRKRRQLWIDTPIILSLDEDFDSYAQQFLNPSPVVAVQPTRMPMLKLRAGQILGFPVQPSVGLRPSSYEFPNSHMFRDGLPHLRPLRPHRPALPINSYVVPPDDSVADSRLGAVGLVNLFAQALGVAPTSIVTSTTTVTEPKTTFVTSSGTLVISGCSPPGITYSTC